MDKIICIDKHHLKEEGKLAQDHIGKPKLSEDDWPMKVIKEIVRQNSQNDGANGSSSSMAQKGWQFDEPGETMRSDGKSPPRGQNRHQVKEEEGMPPRAQSGKYGFPNGLKPHELIHLFFNVPYGKRHESPLLDKMKKRSEKMKMRPDDAKKQPDSPRPNLTGENKQLNPNAKEYVPQKLTKAGSANPHNVGMQQPHPYSPFSSYIYGQNDVIPPPPPYKVGPNLSLGHQYRGGGGGGKEGVKKGGTGAFLPRGTGKVGVENSAKMKQHEKKDEKEETMKRNDEEDDGEEVIVYKGRKPTN